MSNNTETLHVTFLMSGAGELREAFRRVGRSDRVAAFCEFLQCGPIDPPTPEDRLRWLVDELGFERKDWDWLPGDVARFWRLISDSAAHCVVWTSSRSAGEHSAFLSWLECMGDQPYDVIDLANVDVTWRRSGRGPALSLGLLSADQIAGDALWDGARPLSSEERRGHGDSWRKLRAENAPLRIIGCDGLCSAPMTYLDERLLSLASHDWQPAVRLIGFGIAEDGDYFQQPDFILASRLHALIGAGKLECRLPPGGLGTFYGLTPLLRYAEVRLARIQS